MSDHSARESNHLDEPTASRGGTFKLLALLGVGSLIAFIIFQYGDLLSIDRLAEKESELRDYQSDHPYLVYGVAFFVYVAVTGLSLPGAAGLTLVYGWYFGFWRGLVLISFASTIGATIAFLMSRYLLRDMVQNKFGDKLESINQQLEKEGAFYLFTLRLIPAFPFFMINLVMGLTPLKARTYYWISQLGMLPGTAVYVYAGSRVPSLLTLAEQGVGAVFSPSQLTQLLVAFGLLGAFPLVVKKIMNRLHPDPQPVTSE